MATAVRSQMLPAMLKVSTELLSLQKQFKIFLFAKQNSKEIIWSLPLNRQRKKQSLSSIACCIFYSVKELALKFASILVFVSVKHRYETK